MADVEKGVTNVHTDNKPAHAELEHTISHGTSSGSQMKRRLSRRHSNPAQDLVGEQRIDLTEEDNKRIRRKTDKYILSMLIWVYFLQCLDKTVLGMGNVWGLSEDTHLKNNQYSTVSIMNAIAQVGWQPFSSYLIVRVPARTLMACLILGWGIAQTCMAASTSFGGLVATRFLLGLFEAGCLPLFSMLTSKWYRRSEQPSRVAMWYSMNGIATIVSAFLSWALGHVKNRHIHEWQLLFIIVGVITVFSAPLVWFMIDSDITTARFFEDDYERAQAVERLRANQTGTGSTEFKWYQVLETFYDVKTLLWLAMSICLNVGASVSNVMGPTLLANFGFDKYVATLLNMPFGFLQFILILVASYATTKWRIKSAVLAAFMIPVIIGLALLYATGTSSNFNQGMALAGYYLLSFLYGGNPLIVAWIISNSAGSTKQSTVMSLYNLASAVGNIVGPVLFKDEDKPHYIPGIKAVLGLFCALLACVGLQCVVIAVLNKVRQRQRVAAGKPKYIKDTSMESKYTAFGQDDETEEPDATDDAATARPHVKLGQNALLDLTDYENDEMVYVY